MKISRVERADSRYHPASSTNVKPAAKQTNAAKKNNVAKTKPDISDGVKNLSVEEAVKIRSKNLDVLAEYKKVKQKSAANFVVIGTTSTVS